MWLRRIGSEVKSSLWFLPGLFVLFAVGLAIGLVESHGYLDQKVFERWPRLFGAGASGARDLLATIASSMITVAGVVFSITIVALSLASSQYTSRVLRNFMGDRVNQAVLGVFVGIFSYCLVVLRTIRSGDEGAFVPSLAVLFGLLLGFVGIAVLIYFIHHIATSIQASHILATVAGETLRAVDHLFPEGVGEEGPDAPPDSLRSAEAWHPVVTDRLGYIQSIDTARLLEFAAERGVVVRMERAIGQFVIEGTPLASVLGSAPPSDADTHRLGELYDVGRQRTVEQDAGYGIRQIVDVALKALSPGVNDTTTAVMCIDYLTAILIRLTGRRIESSHRTGNGEVRLLTCGPTYSSMVGEAYDQIRQNARDNVAIIDSLLGSLELLASRTTSPSRRRVLAEHARAIDDLVHRSVRAPRDLQLVGARSARVMGLLQAPPQVAVAGRGGARSC